MRKKLYILLHCESCYNKEGVFCGRADVSLTETGHIHAKNIAEQLKSINFALAYTSPLKRSKQTLKHIIVHHPNTKIITDKKITERDYGELTHLVKKEYKKNYPKLYPIYHRSYDVVPPGGESIKQVEKRILPFLKEIIKKIKTDNINILIVTHSNAMRPMRKYLENLTNKEMMLLENQRDKIFEYSFDVLESK